MAARTSYVRNNMNTTQTAEESAKNNTPAEGNDSRDSAGPTSKDDENGKTNHQKDSIISLDDSRNKTTTTDRNIQGEDTSEVHKHLLRTRCLEIAVLLAAYVCGEYDMSPPVTLTAAGAALPKFTTNIDSGDAPLDSSSTNAGLSSGIGTVISASTMSAEVGFAGSGEANLKMFAAPYGTTDPDPSLGIGLRPFTKEEEKALMKALPKEV
jgi:hypothetical protein